MPGTDSPTANSRQLVVSSSANARLHAARTWLQDFARDREVVVLVPHANAADQLVHSLVAAVGSRFGVQRFTLNRLASRLAAPELARRKVVPATSLSLAAVATRAVYRVVGGREAGRLA